MTPDTNDGAAKPPVFSRPFDVDAQKDFPVKIEIDATETERAALAEDLDIPAISMLKARLRIAGGAGGHFHVTGVVEAKVVRTCVVSLEDFEMASSEAVDVEFARPPEGLKTRRRDKTPEKPEVVVDEGIDPPGPIIDGNIDLGIVVAEFLALGLDPHPRKPGVVFEPAELPGDAKVSPFAALARLKNL